jgi:hypothetical protein
MVLKFKKQPKRELKRERKLDILHAYVMATGGQLPTDLGELLGDMRELIGEVSEAEVREAIRWAVHPRSLPFPRPNPPRQPSKHLRAVT